MTILSNEGITFVVFDVLLKLMVFISVPLSWIFCKELCTGEQIFTVIITGPLSGLVYGVAVGYLYGKIKNRNSAKVNGNIS